MSVQFSHRQIANGVSPTIEDPYLGTAQGMKPAAESQEWSGMLAEATTSLQVGTVDTLPRMQ